MPVAVLISKRFMHCQYLIALRPLYTFKLSFETYNVSGGHTWMNYEIYLSTTLQELFK